MFGGKGLEREGVEDEGRRSCERVGGEVWQGEGVMGRTKTLQRIPNYPIKLLLGCDIAYLN